MKHVQRVGLLGRALYRVFHLFMLAGLFLAVPEFALHAQSPTEKKLDPATEAAYRRLTAAVDPARLDAHMRALAAIPSRVAGYPGARRAAEYVEQQFRQAGLTGVTTEMFEVTVPVSEGLRIKDPVILTATLTQATGTPLVEYVLGRLTPDTRQKVQACAGPVADLQQAEATLAREKAAYQQMVAAQPTLPGGVDVPKPSSLIEADKKCTEARTAFEDVLGQVEPALVDELDAMCASGSLYTAQRFAGIKLSAEANRLLARAPQGKERVALNRQLIADAFPQAVTVLGTWMQVGSQRIPLYPLWPNQVQTSKLPSPEQGGLQAPVIDVGAGKLANFNGKTVDGSVVMVDFNSAQEWLNAPRLGAKAVLFVEPESTQRGEAEGKFISIPLAIPRFWIARKDAD